MTRNFNLLTVGRSALLFIIAITFSLFLAAPVHAETPTKLYGVVTD
jgi:hypothetical protein